MRALGRLRTRRQAYLAKRGLEARGSFGPLLRER